MPWSALQETSFPHSIEVSHHKERDLLSLLLAATILAYRENHPCHSSGRQETRVNNPFSAGLLSELQEPLKDNEDTTAEYSYQIP